MIKSIKHFGTAQMRTNPHFAAAHLVIKFNQSPESEPRQSFLETAMNRSLLVLSGSLLAALAACGGSDDAGDATTAPVAEEPADTGAGAAADSSLTGVV